MLATPSGFPKEIRVAMYAIWRSLGPQRGRGVVADVVKVWEVPVVNVLVVGLQFDRAFGHLQEMGTKLLSRRFVYRLSTKNMINGQGIDNTFDDS